MLNIPKARESSDYNKQDVTKDSILTRWEEQDGRLAPAYFSPNYKDFDQLLQTVKNKNYCFEFSFQSFYKHQFHHWFCTLCKRVPLKNFLSRSAEKRRRETLLCCVSENFQ